MFYGTYTYYTLKFILRKILSVSQYDATTIRRVMKTKKKRQNYEVLWVGVVSISSFHGNILNYFFWQILCCRSFQTCRGSGLRRTIASCGPSARNRRGISLRLSAGRTVLSGPVSSICRIRPTRRICVASLEKVLLRGSLHMPHRHHTSTWRGLTIPT